ncbi:MAG: hypothetical protein GQ536_01100 [Candidatus Aminicenantes bacterium]|jgi:hypothetical protein|nr:hypothetical protein [Candidatus Aminicenantes bacterium]
MESCYKLIKRRKFLKTGIRCGAFMAALPIWNIFSSSASFSDRQNRPYECHSERSQERIRDVMLKYGGEFADIKPELRRNSYGSI